MPGPQVSPPPTATASAVRWGQAALAGALALALAVLLGVLRFAPAALPVLPAVVAGALGLGMLLRRPEWHLTAVIAGFVFVFQFEEGVSPTELAFGAYSTAYLAGWFGVALLGSRPIVQSWGDRALVGLLVYLTLSLLWTPLRGGDIAIALNQWRLLLILGFALPIRDVVARGEDGARRVLLAALFATMFVVARNFLLYLEAMQSAEALWQVVGNRATRPGERLILVSLLATFVFAVFEVRTVRARLALAALAGAQLGAVVAAQGRTAWLALILGLGAMVLLLGGRERLRLIAVVGGGAAAAAVLAWLVLGDVFGLFLVQIGERASSIGTAGTQDVSLINRFREWRTVWEVSLQSPVFGTGFGVPYRFYSVIYGATEVKHFVHSAYLSFFYRHGAVGIVLMAVALVGAFGKSVRIARRARSRFDHAVGLACASASVAFALAISTEPALTTAEGPYVLALLMGLAGGTWERQRAARGAD